MKNILDYNKDEVKQILKENNFQTYRADQIFSYLKLAKKFEEMNLPKDLKEFLINNYQDIPISIFRVYESKIDKTKKFLLKLNDNNIIESVLMKYKYGYTICVSTQVGCRMGCYFCMSGKDGLIRNLTCAEILSEVLILNRYLYEKENEKITNIVLMGSGEPFDNYDNVLKFLRQVNSEDLLNISRRNISLSTCGLVDKIDRFANDDFNLTLTISLHAPNDEIRKKIMPVDHTWPLEKLMASLDNYTKETNKRIFYEYIMIN